MSNFEKAERSGDSVLFLSLKDTIETKIKAGNRQLKFYYLTLKANRHLASGQFKEAKLLFSKVINEAQGTGEYFTLSSAYGSLGTTAFFENQYDTAITFWNKSIEISEKHNIIDNLSAMQSNLGVVYLNKGYASTASHYFLKSKSNMEKIGKIDENYYVNH